ncbi:MAG: SUMF1/EgtB/PvdO family nonheme iron enzyme [Pseudomonadota bacterium]
MAVGACSSYAPSDHGWGRDRRAVINVHWSDAKAYASWLSAKTGRIYRLLTEVAWEYAARAGTTTAYAWGNAVDEGQANCDGCGTQWDNVMTAPVGSFAPDAFGLFDMLGNVGEWVEDCYRNRYDGRSGDSFAITYPDCERGVRGGAWADTRFAMFSAARGSAKPTQRESTIGIRLARTLKWESDQTR